MEVRGEVGKVGKEKYEKWFAKITGFEFSTHTEGSETGVLDVSHVKDPHVSVVWFHAPNDPLEKLPKTFKDRQLKEALGGQALATQVYLLGTCSQSIPLGSINGKGRTTILTMLSKGSPGIVVPVNVSGLCPTLPDEHTVFYRWLYYQSSLQIVSFYLPSPVQS